MTAAQIGAVPNKYLFCHNVRFHGSAIFFLFQIKVKYLNVSKYENFKSNTAVSEKNMLKVPF